MSCWPDVSVVTPPAIEPVTTMEAREQLRIDEGCDEALLARLITTAREWCEDHLWRRLVTTVLRADWDHWPGRSLLLPGGTVQSVASVTYLDSSGVRQTLDAAKWELSRPKSRPAVVPAYGLCWPTARCGSSSIQVTYSAGYGSTAASVPAAIRHAILLLVGQWHQSREAIITGTIVAEAPFTVKNLLAPHSAIEVV